MSSPTPTRRLKVGKWLLYGVAVLLFLWTLLLEPLGYTRFIVGILFAALVGVIVRLIFYPYSDPWDSAERRLMQGSPKAEYERLAGSNGITLQEIWVSERFSRIYGFAQVYGLLPNNRHLLLHETFFDLYTPEERRAVIARESKLAASYYNLYAATLHVDALIAYFFIRAFVRGTPVAQWPFVSEALALVLLLAGVWSTRRKVYRADAFAAKQTSPKTVIQVLEKFSDEKREDEAATIKLLSLVGTRPSPEVRIERLQNRFEDVKTS